MSNLKSILKKSLSLIPDNENDRSLSVVCILFKDNDIFFIHRAEDMPTHKGDVAFVGGHKKTGELTMDAARREIEEELSISICKFTFMGYLPTINTSFRSLVSVCCFEILETQEDFLNTVKSNGEWSEAFFVEHTNFLNLNNWSYSELYFHNEVKKVFFCKIPFDRKNLWGMSASIIYKLFENKLKNAI